MNDNIFREYDIRGKYPFDINEDVAYRIGLGYGSYLQEFLNQDKCIISYDNRISSFGLATALINGLTDTGINVINTGLSTTPMHYFARQIYNLYGIMITASHNPKDDNGFKFSFDHYANARGQMIQDFKDYIKKGEFKKGIGYVENIDITEEYIQYITKNIKLGNKKLKVVLDPANGVSCTIARKIYEKFNIDLTIINEESDGTFPNHHPDPSVEENLQQLKNKVLEVHADIGIGFDGDGDRIGIIDNCGNRVLIEDYAILILRNIIDKVDNKKFLYDAKCSSSFKDEIIKLGATPVICRTGSSYTMLKVAEEKIPLGIQYVGHISLSDRTFDSESAMMSSLRLIEILSKTEYSLNNLIDTIPHYLTTHEIKIASKDNIKNVVIKQIQNYCDKMKYRYEKIDGLMVYFKDSWAYIRASNTGPNICLKCEAKNERDLKNLEKLFSTLINTYNE